MKKLCFFTIFFITFFSLIFVVLADSGWWDSAWMYRRSITIDNTQNSNTLTNYQVPINVTYDSDMQSDFDDLRFIDSDDSTELNYWIENKSDSSWAYVWINITSIPGSDTKDIYMYYNNSAVSTTGNAEKTFELYDNFDDNSLDTNKWQTRTDAYSGASITETNQRIECFSRGYLFSVEEFHNVSVKFRANTAHQYQNIQGNTRSDADPQGTYGEVNNSIQILWAKEGNNLYTRKWEDGTATTIQQKSADPGIDNWHTIHMKIFGDSPDIRLEVLVDGTTHNLTNTSLSYSPTSDTEFLLFYCREASFRGYTYFDDVRVAKYTYPEPNYSIGSEEIESLDITPPQYFNVGQNKTTDIRPDDVIKFYAYWIDDVDLSHHIFSWNSSDNWENVTTESFVTSPTWPVFPGWVYRVPINISSSFELTDYQVFINVPYDSHMNSDFSDLRFTYYNSTSKTETEIPYWIENKVDSGYAEIWVKVPYIASSGYETIYMYYGNPSATSKSDGIKTFEFFDNFSTDPSSEWTIHRYDGDLSTEAWWDSTDKVWYLTKAVNSRGVAVFPNYDLSSKAWKVDFRYKAGGGTGADGVVFMFYKNKSAYVGKRPAGGGNLGFCLSENGWVDPCEYPVSGYGIELDNWENAHDPSANHIAIIKDDVGNHLTYVNDDRTEDNLWHNATVTFINGKITVKVDEDIVIDYTISDPDYSYRGVGFSSGTGGSTNNHIIDDFRIQKFIDPEPTSSIGSEEEGIWGGGWSNITRTIIQDYAGKTIGWQIYANDTSNNWNFTPIKTFEVESLPFTTLTLEKGWNLISIPNISVVDVHTTQDPCNISSKGFYYYNASKKVYDAFSLKQLEGGKGYWIYIPLDPDFPDTCEVSVSSSGVTGISDIPSLISGYNLIGAPSTSTSISSLSCSIIDGPYYWDADAQDWIEVGPTGTLEPERGYWLKCS